MKHFVSLGAALLLGSVVMAFPWSTPPCEESGTWCRDSNSGQSAFNGWQQLPSSGFGSPYHKHIAVPVEHILARPHILAGVLGLSREIEEVVELILEASSREAAADQLKSDYGLSETQAIGILDMPLEQLTVDGLEALELEYRSYVN